MPSEFIVFKREDWDQYIYGGKDGYADDILEEVELEQVGWHDKQYGVGGMKSPRRRNDVPVYRFVVLRDTYDEPELRTDLRRVKNRSLADTGEAAP